MILINEYLYSHLDFILFAFDFMATRYDVAELLLPGVDSDIQKLIQKYPKRDCVCTRIAPSPTGFLHFWSLFMALINWKYAKQNKGVFFLRIEDTDQKREVEWAATSLVKSLKKFWIEIDEWPIGDNETEIWNYGPYVQSKRADFYKVFIKYLIEEGVAYPCWMSEEELNEIRDQQMKNKQIPWIYGEFSKYRSYSPDEAIAKYHEMWDSFSVIRFRSPADLTKKIIFSDELRGVVSMIDNYNDIVILKWDWLPTYHLAHIVDDTLMWTSLVMRWDEWLTSVPLHLQLFKAFSIPAPKYAHVAPISKLDEWKKRKLSKRHDPEADVRFFFEKWYATQWLIDYILTLASSSFEDWRKDNQLASLSEFNFDLQKMTVAAPLFDEIKLQWINNQYLSAISTEQLFKETLEWAEDYDLEFASLLKSEPEYYQAAMNIERHTEKDPKRFTVYSDVRNQILFFSDEEWKKWESSRKELLAENENFSNLQDFVKAYIDEVNLENVEVLQWFEQLKEIWKRFGYAWNNAEFKQWWFVWKVGDLAMFLRIQLCNAKQTPDLFSLMKVMWKDRVKQRLWEYLK